MNPAISFFCGLIVNKFITSIPFMQELIPINIIVADRSYRIRILPEDEENVRKTLKTINDKIIEFKTNFSGKDMQDYIAMVLLWYASLSQQDNNSAAGQTDLLEALQKMELQLDKAL
jgi:cell division protein ZapA